MWPDRVSNPGPLTYESGALPTALRGLGWPLSFSKRKCSATTTIFEKKRFGSMKTYLAI